MNEPSQEPQFEPLSRVQVLIAMGVTAVMLLIVARIWLSFGNAALLPVRLDWLSAGLGVALGLGITAASWIVYRLWEDYRNSADFYLNLVIRPLSVVDLIWLGLLPGMSEELLFRGVMLPAFGLNWVGVAISSLCFGVLHFSGSKQWPYVIWATVVGVILGIGAVETGNLLVPVVAHVTTNVVSSLIWKQGHGNISPVA